MTFIIGLGNPGAKYQQTKHNAGFIALDYLAEKLQMPKFRLQKIYQAQVSQSEKLFLVKPQTYMNKSGDAILYLKKKHPQEFKQLSNLVTSSLSNFFVVHDDLDLELGNFKIQFGKGPKVHNGLNSIYAALGTDQFWHVRVGIDSRGGDRSIPSDKYVLMPFSVAEQEIFDQVSKQVADELILKL